MPGGPRPEKVPAPKTTLVPAPASIIVSLPAGARLTVDGEATKSDAGVRVFESPTLQPGKDYFYTLKADITRDNQSVSVSQKVSIRAGDETRVSFEFPVAAVAQR
jgi:uncharacterized protein (TIGR03000 family)